MRLKRITIAALLLAMLLPCTAYADGTRRHHVEPPQEATQEQPAMSGEEFRFRGVVEYGGHEETWYSSAVLRHWRTGEWEADDEGFYRDSEGRYVVASDAYGQGTVIQTSRGPAVVLDSGCGDNVDFYVNWGDE